MKIICLVLIAACLSACNSLSKDTAVIDVVETKRDIGLVVYHIKFHSSNRSIEATCEENYTHNVQKVCELFNANQRVKFNTLGGSVHIDSGSGGTQFAMWDVTKETAR